MRVVVDDLAFVPADAIVRPATATLEPTTPALRRLEQVGGQAFWNQMRTERELAVGSAVVTGGGDLSAELVIHAIIRSATIPCSKDTVRRALTSALQRAADWRLAHLAIPPLGTGAGNLSLDDAADVMCTTLNRDVPALPFPADVTLVVETPEEQAVFERALQRAAPA
ncbi:MAG TPA: macro domain-containing protein [Gemmatimonadales bacterium]|nr:macro domain-containing protein [Gemmatimonadales bacterium]